MNPPPAYLCFPKKHLTFHDSRPKRCGAPLDRTEDPEGPTTVPARCESTDIEPLILVDGAWRLP